MPVEERFGIAAALSVDPRRTGVVVPRFVQQAGELPADAITSDPDEQVSLWVATAANIPKLEVPNGWDAEIMAVADRLEMRGGGPHIYSREEAEQVAVHHDSIIRINAAARGASRQRILTALELKKIHPEHHLPLFATTDLNRVLGREERSSKVVAEIASEARNELELFVDSAYSLGFVAGSRADDGSFLPSSDHYLRYGVRFSSQGAYQWLGRASGEQILLFAPNKHVRPQGGAQSGLYDAYYALGMNDEVLNGAGFQLAGRHIVDVTSSHYGLMAGLSNVRAVHELNAGLGSYVVVGDNQPDTRTAKAHLIEIGHAANAIEDMRRDYPSLWGQIMADAA